MQQTLAITLVRMLIFKTSKNPDITFTFNAQSPPEAQRPRGVERERERDRERDRQREREMRDDRDRQMERDREESRELPKNSFSSRSPPADTVGVLRDRVCLANFCAATADMRL